MTDKEYDLFISYASEDASWVEGYLLDALEGAGARVHSEQAFLLGAPLLTEFERAIQSSWRTLLVLSPAYLVEHVSQFVDLLVQSYGLETATWPVIPLILKSVELPPRLAMLTPLNATDPVNHEAVIERLCANLKLPVPGPPPIPECPYPGMVPFNEDDSERFFGRDTEIEELIERLRLHPFITIIGPSGSGKSSLIFAGLLSALRKSRRFGKVKWTIKTMHPGPTPFSVLSSLGLDEEHKAGDEQVLLIVDQFEETFTLAGEETRPFQQALSKLTKTLGIYVVLSVRADFYADLMGSPLWPLVRAHRLEVPPLNTDGLRQAIVRPAESAGVFIETALVERLLMDAAEEPGVLPLLQETLVLLWERVERRFLPLRAYEALVLSRSVYGMQRTGLEVAIARRADAALADLTPEAQVIAKRIFLRLIQFGEGRADTRRQQPVEALRSAGEAPLLFDHTLQHLVDRRLVTLSGERETTARKVDLAHEALISGWPTLQRWLVEQQELEQTRRQLEMKAVEWFRRGQGSSGLLDQDELIEAEEWLRGSQSADLGYSETLCQLVEASHAAQSQRIKKERRTRRAQAIAWSMAAVIIVTALAIFRVWRIGEEREIRVQRAEQLADASQSEFAESPQRSLLLAIEALKITMDKDEPPAAAAQNALWQALTRTGGRALIGHGGAIHTVAISPNSRWLVTGGADGMVLVWDMQDSTRASIPLRYHESSVVHVAFSSDGRWLVTASDDGTVCLWSTSSAMLPTECSKRLEGINVVAFSYDDRWFAAGNNDGIVNFWEMDALDTAPIILAGQDEAILALAFAASSDGQWLFASYEGRYVGVFDLTTTAPAATYNPLPEQDAQIDTLVVSHDGRWLVTVDSNNVVELWDLGASMPPMQAALLLDRGPAISTVAFSPDGHWLVTGSGDGTTQLWDMRAADVAASVNLPCHTEYVTAVAFSYDSRWLVTSSTDKSVCVWDMFLDTSIGPAMILQAHEGPVEAVAVSSDGQWLVTAGADATARQWNLSSPLAEPVILHHHTAAVNAMATNIDGSWLITGDEDGTLKRCDLTRLSDGKYPDCITLPSHTAAIRVIAMSFDDHWGIVSSKDGQTQLCETDSWTCIDLSAHNISSQYISFSTDNRWLVTASSNDNIACAYDLDSITADEAADYCVNLPDDEAYVRAVAVTPDSQRLLIGSSDGTLSVCELVVPDPMATLTVLSEEEGQISALATDPTNRWVTIGRRDGGFARCDLEAVDFGASCMPLPSTESPIYATATSFDHHWLAVSSGTAGKVYLFDLSDPTAQHRTFEYDDFAWAIAFSQDNRWLITGGEGGTVSLCDLDTDEPTNNCIYLPGHNGIIRAVAISQDNRRLITGGEDTTVRIWSLQPDDLIEVACGTVGRNLTSEEWAEYLPWAKQRPTCP